jgi:hypothetical protein
LSIEDGQLAVAEMSFTVHFTADLSYDDSTTGIYDGEDDRMLFVDRRYETVQRMAHLKVEVQVGFQGIDPDSFEVIDVILKRPSSAVFLKTAEAHGYPWK